MKILSLKASGVFGRFSYDLNFNDDLSLITGSNGSGKTTALKLLASLLTPDFDWLFTAIVEKAVVEIVNNNKRVKITFQNDGINDVHLTYSGEKTKDALFKLSQDDVGDFLNPRKFHGRVLRDSTYSHVVVEKISSLPTPMYLSLERKNVLDWNKLESQQREEYLRQGNRGSKQEKGIAVNVDKAVRLVNDSVRKMEIANQILTDQLSRDLLLTPYLAKSKKTKSLEQQIELIKELLSIQDNIIDAYTLLGVKSEKLKASAGKFFRELKKQDLTAPDKLDENSDDISIQKLVELMSLAPVINILQEHSKLVHNYQKESQIVYRERSAFLHALNLFFSSSELAASFDNGYLEFRAGNENDINPHHLSSGEKQIFMLLSHLMFNQQGAESSIIVIDEPELSLHIGWQEIFCDSILEVRPDLQAIFATHSPSIIGNKVEKCLTL